VAPERSSVFEDEFREDVRYWVKTGRRIAARLLDIVEAVMRDPFQGLGKPEPLKHLGSDIWSRRLTQEHCVVYLAQQDAIHFLKAEYDY
jgi:toxin YoeB